MWGIVFLVTTTFVMVFKRETAISTVTSSDKQQEVQEVQEVVEMEQGIIDTYKQLIKIVQLPSVLSLISILLTAKVSYPVDIQCELSC